ncbi:uncharacterized protein N7483_012466 [Penicillium malachiteum]|uniref:uncharacterized protein n=1 Tax=Penicillium malachiteum TaxID=1324776 RepID=UPI002546DE0D|nr:uncharacterized protein N7483_012466 [Penicillium malachiteum]KAJ5715285.1 hypothetical protein N7483_012466 [Penicillium malachiteum]
MNSRHPREQGTKKCEIALSTTIKLHLGPRSNVFKACDACRQRKLKCNGLNPCERCINNSAQCNYRKKARRRDTATQKTVTNQRATFIPIQPAVDHLVIKAAQPRETEIDDQNTRRKLQSILKTIRITDSVPSRGTVTRTFGCTSSAAVLSLLLDLIWQSNSFLILGSEMEYSNDHTRDVLRYILQVFAISESSRRPPLNPTLPGPLDTVSLEIQSVFLDQYISMAWKVLPFQSPNSLRAQLPHLADQAPSPMFDDGKARRSIFFPMLGIGAITAGYAELGSLFIADAQRETLTAEPVGDILAFQSDLLMISLVYSVFRISTN